MNIVDGDGDGDDIHGSLGSIGVCQDNVRSLPVPHRSKLQILCMGASHQWNALVLVDTIVIVIFSPQFLLIILSGKNVSSHCHCWTLSMLNVVRKQRDGKYIFIRPDYSTDTRFPPHTIQEWGGDIFRRSYLERQDFGKQMRPRVKNRREVDSLQSLQKVLSRFTTSPTWIKYCFYYWPTLVRCD